jgi:fructokinase
MGRPGAPPRIVCWGEVLWDLFPDGRRLGGAPANVAYHLATLGADVALVSRVGDDDLGRAAVAELAAAGVDVGAVQVDRERPTGAVGVELVDGEARYAFHPGCAWEHIELDDRARALVASANAICFGTLSQRRPEGRAMLDAALAARGSGPSRCLAVCDLNVRPIDLDADLVRWALAASDVLKLNEREEALLGQLFETDDLASWLRDELDVAAVAVTRGPAGCRISASGPARVIDQPGLPATPGGDSVGCGDAFTAVLALGLVSRASIEEIAAAACRYAAAVAGYRGAMPRVPAELVTETREALGLR